MVRGSSARLRLAVDAGPRIVGRARDADLVLRDARVSRQHLSVRADGDAVHVEVSAGALPFLLNGVPHTEGRARVGDTIVVGDTALVVSPSAGGDAAEPSGWHSTKLGALMTGLTADVRGVAAAMELVDALDLAEDEAALGTAMLAWGKEHLAAVDARLLLRDEIEAVLGASPPEDARVVERPGDAAGTVLLVASAPASEPAWAAFTFTQPAGGITDSTRRLVVLAARLCGSALTRAGDLRASREQQERLRRASVGSARSFLGDCPAALEIARLVPRLAASDALVLIEGETGVGKTFIARLIHEQSPRASQPLRVINCAAIPDTLIESELFGHERGAFTGATSARAGALESAERGTLLLDEIGELPLASQAKLLRVLEEKRFERLGSNRPIRLAARVLVATNRDLVAMAEEGTFRKDLYYRVAVVRLEVPPLRSRGGDLVLLAERILADLVPQAGRRVQGFSAAAVEAIERYSWPGNVRELRNAIERALVVGDGPRIELRDLPETVHGRLPAQPDDASLLRLPASLATLEARAIDAALRSTGGNQKQAAALLGISRNTLRRKLHPGDGVADDGD